MLSGKAIVPPYMKLNIPQFNPEGMISQYRYPMSPLRGLKSFLCFFL
ncbi:MAG: hypothetical protein JETT_2956 [Candidatus Jettenia ecosi]|uniref:Uncharacterized protein n=1 Tax=Candidatus Jettenia ecosi TaxID=2494326 RepID=A0A533Q825_9BACT|nr:MAG: hypothetical protein JETT_2956 [Candidatus Jettenia ecosi]